MDNPEAARIRSELELLIQSDYHGLISTWEEAASKAELKGLALLASVCKHRGQKRFRYSGQVHKQYSFQEAGRTIRKQQMQSYYVREFGESPTARSTDIVQYKKISELPFSIVLNKAHVHFLERWIALKDNPDYVDLILQFLRSFYSIVKVHHLTSNTSTREDFPWYSTDDRRRFWNSTLKQRPTPSPTPRFFNERRNVSVDLPDVQFYVPESPRDKLIKGLKGSGEITSWIANVQDEKGSVYQTSYPNSIALSRRRTENLTDMKTSMINRILPDIRDRLKTQYC